jgi:hypothetical protein
MDLQRRLDQLKPSASTTVGEDEWQALREYLTAHAQHYDRDKAFTDRFIPFGLPLDFVLRVYEAGRQHRVPEEWLSLLHTSRVQRSDEYVRFQDMKQNVALLMNLFAPHEQLLEPESVFPQADTQMAAKRRHEESLVQVPVKQPAGRGGRNKRGKK